MPGGIATGDHGGETIRAEVGEYHIEHRCHSETERGSPPGGGERDELSRGIGEIAGDQARRRGRRRQRIRRRPQQNGQALGDDRDGVFRAEPIGGVSGDAHGVVASRQGLEGNRHAAGRTPDGKNDKPGGVEQGEHQGGLTREGGDTHQIKVAAKHSRCKAEGIDVAAMEGESGDRAGTGDQRDHHRSDAFAGIRSRINKHAGRAGIVGLGAFGNDGAGIG